MKIERFSPDKDQDVKLFVLDVLAEEGFAYDRGKDFDLDDINGYYMNNGGMFFIATIHEEVMGTSAVRRQNDTTCEIKRIYVKKGFRGKGYGRELFLHALDYARDNCQSITLKTDSSLTEAINMYLKYGFSMVKAEGDTLYFMLQHG